MRPDLVAQEAAAFSENAVFMLDTSLSESPDRFVAVSMKLLRFQILASDPDIKHFNVLAFNVAVPTGSSRRAGSTTPMPGARRPWPSWTVSCSKAPPTSAPLSKS